MNPSDQGVPTPPVEPAATATTPSTTTPTGSETVTNSGSPVEQSVPFTRFQEVNDAKKAAEEKARVAQEELESYKSGQQRPATQDEDIEPETLEVIKKSASKLGLVSREELDAREAKIQVQQDINDLTESYKSSGVPFDGRKVIDYAKANGIPLGSKQSLDAVYKQMNYEAIVDAQRKAAVEAYVSGSKNSAERPGSSASRPSEEQKPSSLKDRIKSAREKAGFSVS